MNGGIRAVPVAAFLAAATLVASADVTPPSQAGQIQLQLGQQFLTEDRYQDAEWDEQHNVISVYDSRARSFQRKRVFSGGARDQISLALRLAFALATLPGEYNVRPGWLFLDEPLSSFDPVRTQALVDLLTRGLIRRQFAQIFLISHSQSFDPAEFDYRIRLDAGQIAESNLPAA